MIDIIFVNCPIFPYSGLIYVDISDHLLIFVILDHYINSNSNTTNLNNPTVTFRVSKTNNIDEFKQLLAEAVWAFITENFMVDNNYNTLVATFFNKML